MRTTTLLLLLQLTIIPNLHAQQEDSLSGRLPEVRVRAYEQGGRLRELPAAVHLIRKETFGMFTPASIVAAVNTTPGVRMEERSPGSYRFNIRGSALRSPFGVRNVKVYFNDLPITDPGGQTYLNQLGPDNFQTLEIIKGPGSSLYGAGTGGVLLIESQAANPKAGLTVMYNRGSYGFSQINASFTTGREKAWNRFGMQHQQSDGYRKHSSLQRDVFSWNGLYRLNEKQELKTTLLFGDLHYETPGALTRQEFNNDPTAARPPVGSLPGAESAGASIRQHAFIAGASLLQTINQHWSNRLVLYGMFTELRNPAIRNYARSAEPHGGARTLFSFKDSFAAVQLMLNFGGEWQEGFTDVSIHKNNGGNPDSLQTMDDIHNRQRFIFSQLSISWNSWTLQGGASMSRMNTRFRRFDPLPSGRLDKSFNYQVSPRFALMKSIRGQKHQLHLYAGISRGFSPPATTELFPTGSPVNLGLQPEEGTNYDAGIRLTLPNHLYIDVNSFLFALRNTVVQRRDSAGGEYFINAGKTRQKGFETYISYPLVLPNHQELFWWLSHTWHRFQYRSFRQFNDDYSGKRLPGIAAHVLSAGIDWRLAKTFQAAVTYYFSDRMPLNDANTEYAAAYHLLGSRLGYTLAAGPAWKFRLTAGIENLFNEKYSLGPDLNSFGGRYFNAAAGRNYFVSFMVTRE